MSDIDLEALRRQARRQTSETRRGGGESAPSVGLFDMDDIEEFGLQALFVVFVVGLLRHAWLSGNWWLVGGLALFFVVVGLLSELPAIVTGIFEFVLDNYEDIKAWILTIPAVLLALGVFFGALTEGTNLFVALLMGCLSFGAFAVIGQLAFLLLEKALENWGWVLVGITIILWLG